MRNRNWDSVGVVLSLWTIIFCHSRLPLYANCAARYEDEEQRMQTVRRVLKEVPLIDGWVQAERQRARGRPNAGDDTHTTPHHLNELFILNHHVSLPLFFSASDRTPYHLLRLRIKT